MKKILFAALLGFASLAHAGTTRSVQADNINATGGAALTVPATGSNLVSDTATQTLTNKTLTAPVLGGTITGTYTLGGTPTIAGSAVSGNITGNAANITATSNSTLTTLSALSLPGTQVTGNISGNAGNITATSNSTLTTLSALSLPGTQVTGNISGNAANVTGTVALANGGTNNAALAATAGGVLYTDGTKVVNVGAGTAGYVLQSNGASAPTWISPTSGGMTNVVATAASPQLISAATAIAVTGQIVNGPNLVFVAGSAAPVTVTATPSITACTAAGEILTLIGESATNTVTLQDNAGLSGSKLQLNGNITLGLNSSITFQCDAAAGNWVEISRR